MRMLIWITAGAVAGLNGGLVGMLAGGVLGLLVCQLREERRGQLDAQTRRIDQLERELAALQRQLPLPTATSAPDAPPVLTGSADTPAPLPPAPAPEPADESLPADLPPRPLTASLPPADDADDLDALYARWRERLLGGNTLVRVGIVLLFFGLAFLARYAVDHALLPPSLRLAGIAAAGVALLAVGWRLRERRRGYGLSLQGAGVAVLYLCAYAGLRLYALLTPGASFAVMLAMVGLAALLAVRQNAAALAVIGTAGGFAAPLLTSSGTGNHVELFGYYALLNLGVLALAWRRAWRGLNLTGFLFTFVIGLAWGAQAYHPAHFASTEPFLILFFLMYVAAALLYALRQTPALRDPVDATLVFGVPVVGFGLQAALVQGMPYALAWSAAALGAFYLLTGTLLRRGGRPQFALLGGCFIALGATFATLAIPLAFDGRWSAAAWALEGAALLWVGLVQQRRWVAAAGQLLQLGAGLLFGLDLQANPDWRGAPLVNGAFLGSTLIALAGFLSSWRLDREPVAAAWLRRLPAPAWIWAWGWWLFGGWAEIDAQLPARFAPAALLMLFAVSGNALVRLATRLDWPRAASAALVPVLGMGAALLLGIDAGRLPSAHWGWAAWPLALLAHADALRHAEGSGSPRLLGWVHAAGVWALAVMGSQELGLRADRLDLGSGWWVAAYALPPALLLALLAQQAQRPPLERWRGAYLLQGGLPLVLGLAAWSLMILPLADGGSRPLPYWPLANPLDLGAGVVLCALAVWLRHTADALAAIRVSPAALNWLLAGLAFVAGNGAILRAVHQLGDVSWALPALWASDSTQTAFSLCWALLGLALMLRAHHQARRAVWMAGAGLMAVVVLKLFVVDLASSGTLARIVSFLGAGLLLMVVGYFAPLPPRAGQRSRPSSPSS